MSSHPTCHRAAAIAICLGALTALIEFTYPGGATSAFADLRDYEGHRTQVAAARAASSQLDADLADRKELSTQKRQVVDELAVGRISLSAATRQYVELNRSDAGAAKLIEATFVGDTSDEKTARCLIAFVRRRLAEARETSCILAGLEAQFCEQYGKPFGAE